MEGQTDVLQQRVETVALGRRGVEALERVGAQQEEGIEPEANEGLRREGRQHRALGQATLDRGDQAARHRHYGDPQQHGPLVIAPGTRNLEDPRLHRMRIVGDQFHREIGDGENIEQAQESHGAEQRLQCRGRPDEHGKCVLAARAQHAAEQLQHSERRGEPQGGKADLGDHSVVSATVSRACSRLMSSSSRGM